MQDSGNYLITRTITCTGNKSHVVFENGKALVCDIILKSDNHLNVLKYKNILEKQPKVYIKSSKTCTSKVTVPSVETNFQFLNDDYDDPYNTDHSNDPDYTVDGENSSSDSNESNIFIPNVLSIEKKLSVAKHYKHLSDAENFNLHKESSFVQEVPEARKNRSKQHFCLFCKKLYTNIAKHLLNQHKDVDRIKKICLIPPNNSERKNMLHLIRKEGDALYNNDENYNQGNIIVCRKSNKTATDKNYGACSTCKGRYSLNNLRTHVRKCNKIRKHGERNIMASSRAHVRKIHPSACEILKTEVFPVLNDDLITTAIRFDPLVITYGNRLCSKYRLKHIHKMIRARLRLIGRFIIAAKELDPIVTDYESCFKPRHLRSIFCAIQKVGGMQSDDFLLKAPSTVANLITITRNVGKLLEAELII